MKKYKFTILGTQYDVEINSVEDQTILLELNGTPYEVIVDKEVKQIKTPKLVTKVVVPSPSQLQVGKIASNGAGSAVKSPLPGTILSLEVKVGDTVKVGQKILVLEAMKMENNIDSDKDGIVQEIKVGKGDSVMEGDTLIVIGG